jgi:glycosyltransferase involved in cell wall biosynthesis
MKPLRIYSLIPPNGSASFYYRCWVTLDTAAHLGLPVECLIDKNDANVPPEKRVKEFCEADLILLYQPIGESPVNNIRGIQSFLPSKRDNEWKWSPSIVIETDDNLFNVSPLNQAFKSLGIRDMNGNLIPIGHHIGVVEEGEKKVLWQDGQKGFSLAKNRQQMGTYRKILEMADQIQCSTPEVEKSVLKEIQPRRIRTFPNLVRFDHYPQVALQQDESKVNIMWQGGIAHYEDWYPLRQAVGNITKRYPEVHWHIWGSQFPWTTELIPQDRLTFHPWCEYVEYKLRMCMMNHDIALAPLTDNVFNRCRSAIKWYESSVLHKPAATLAQNTGAYKAEIQDGKTGLLFDSPEEFEDKLARLVEDRIYRKELAANAKDWISENRDAFKVVPSIIASWEQMRGERTIEQPHVSDEEWSEIEAQDRAEQEAEMGATDDAVPALNESG